MGDLDNSREIIELILNNRQRMGYLFVGMGLLTLMVGFSVVFWAPGQAGEAQITIGPFKVSAKQLGAVVMVTSFSWGYLAYKMRSTLDLNFGVQESRTETDLVEFESLRHLPQDITRKALAPALAQLTGRIRAISPKNKLWVVGSDIVVKFLDGSKEQHKVVEKYAHEWTEYANIRFQFVDDQPGKIRVSFSPSTASWSYQGTDAMSVPADTPTMNLSTTDKSTVLRMFGLALGLNYEQSPSLDKEEWNLEAVIEDLGGPPDYYSENVIRNLLISELTKPQFNGLEHDSESIMVRPIPPRWTKSGSGVQANESISNGDKEVIASENCYPGLES